MEKKSMGSFIAALRKAKGMTQQDVALRLNVSNKTISKWERGEGYPEIMMIPVIAELFNVTADEILKGERIINEESDENNKNNASVKQVRFLLDKMNVKFKNLSFLSFALTLLGLICLFTISYAFYKPVIGFGTMMILVIAAMVIEIIAVNNIHSSYVNSGMLKENSEAGMNYIKLLFGYASFSFSAVIFTVIAGLPFIIVQSDFTNSVITFAAYLRFFPFVVLLFAIFISTGKHIARKQLGRAYFPLLTGAEIKQRKKLNKKFMIVATFVLIVTLAGHILILNSVDKSVIRQKFDTKEKFEEFIAEKEQYEKDRDTAKADGKVLITPHEKSNRTQVKQVITENSSEKEYFYLVSEFERIVDIDYKNYEVIHEMDPEMEARSIEGVNNLFRNLYIIEAVIISILYLLRKRRIKA